MSTVKQSCQKKLLSCDGCGVWANSHESPMCKSDVPTDRLRRFHCWNHWRYCSTAWNCFKNSEGRVFKHVYDMWNRIQLWLGGPVRRHLENLYTSNDKWSHSINSCRRTKKQFGQSWQVCRWNKGACKAIGHPLVEVRLCRYSNELRGLLHGIKELVVIVLIAGLAFSRRCRTLKWTPN